MMMIALLETLLEGKEVRQARYQMSVDLFVFCMKILEFSNCQIMPTSSVILHDERRFW